MKRIFTPSKKKSILIVDDDPFATQIYREKLESQGFKVEVTRDFDSTLQPLKQEVVDLLILDLFLPDVEKLLVDSPKHAFNLLMYIGEKAHADLDYGPKMCGFGDTDEPYKKM